MSELMRRLSGVDVRRSNAGRLGFLVYLLLQELAIVGLPTTAFPDSFSYYQLDLTGKALRLPTVPLVYSILPNDSAILAAQAVLAATAWWILAAVAARLMRERAVAVVLRSALLMLGLSSSVVQWNSTLLSESIAISLTALLLAAWLRFGQSQTPRFAAAALGVTLLWTLTRQSHVIFGLAITTVLVVVAAKSWATSRILPLVAVGAIGISALGLVEISRNREVGDANLSAVIQARILANHGWSQWFVDEGMPHPKSVTRWAGVTRTTAKSSPILDDWVRRKGTATYIKFLVTHPGYTFVAPLAVFVGERESLYRANTAAFPSLQPNPTPAVLTPSVNYGRHRDLIPSLFEDVSWDERRPGSILLLIGATAALAGISIRRWGPDIRFLVPAVAVAMAIPEAYVLWLTIGETTSELDRLSVVTAVSVRIGTWISLALAIDRFYEHRKASKIDETGSML
jgi:hypothetical protein